MMLPESKIKKRLNYLRAKLKKPNRHARREWDAETENWKTRQAADLPVRLREMITNEIIALEGTLTNRGLRPQEG